MAVDITLTEAMTKYPDWAWAINIPEVGDILRRALSDPNYDSGRLQTEIMQTNWYRSTQATAREWDALVQRDPESANARRRQKEADIWDKVIGSGLGPNVALTQDLALKALRFGWNDIQLNDAIVAQAQYSAQQKPVGTIGVAADKVKQLASQYFIPISDETAFNYGKAIAAGEHTLDDFEVGFRDQSKGRFPSLVKTIDQGIRPQDYFAPYKETIAQLLEVPPASVDLVNDPRWSKVLDTADDKGEHRSMTLSETQSYVRGLDDWKGTRQGQQSASAAADAILQMFGKVA